MAAFYTNSIFQSLRFTGPIAWRRSTLRGSVVTLKGHLDVDNWQKFLESRPSLASEHVDAGRFNLQYGHRFGDWLVMTTLSVDMASGDCQVMSSVCERTYDYYKVPLLQ
jgi:hypothetical protein